MTVSCEVKVQESHVQGQGIKCLPHCRLKARKLENDVLFLNIFEHVELKKKKKKRKKVKGTRIIAQSILSSVV